MSLKSVAKNISLTSYDDLFEMPQQGEKIIEIPIEKLRAFQNHPFKVLEDEKMMDTIASIGENGVLVPILVREIGEDYEIIAGHRRTHACKLLNLPTIPAIVKDVTDEQATIIMVDSNIQREYLLPSEKAFAYQLKLDAMKKQGKRSDLTSTQVGQKLNNKFSVEILAEEVGESRNQIQRYIRLTFLNTPLLNLVDNNQLSLNAAVQLSYLNEKEQNILLDTMEKLQCMPSLAQANQLKKYSKEETLDKTGMEIILSQEKESTQKVVIKPDKIKKYFNGYTNEQIESVIFNLLEQWKNGIL